MSMMAIVDNGKVVETTSQASLSGASAASGSSMDKDAFLQLLVAQMKYQDPLEPTSNTEYVSQYAQFSQVEEMQNMSKSMELQRASSLVGQQVYVKTADSSGNVALVQGRVDYVTYEGGKSYVSINESLYALSDVYTVADGDYLDAYETALALISGLNQLPAVGRLTLDDADAVDRLEKAYSGMTAYQKAFVAQEKAQVLADYVARLKELRAAAEEAAKDPETLTETPEEPTDAPQTEETA
ncbi:MAG: flagellar hook capping protein [Clostridium sp.]|jgi:flagellar basal-body rod modification protein FlgD|nr:flagellar hook capping protein [Clostridium sp.]